MSDEPTNGRSRIHVPGARGIVPPNVKIEMDYGDFDDDLKNAIKAQPNFAQMAFALQAVRWVRALRASFDEVQDRIDTVLSSIEMINEEHEGPTIRDGGS